MSHLAICILLVLLTACQAAPEAFTPAPLTFSSKPAINIKVAKIKLINSYNSPIHTPFVEHQFPTAPADAIKQWVADRLHATGTKGILEISIDDASVKEVKLIKTQGVQGLFTNDQDARYDANIRVSMKLYDGSDPISVASGEIIISRSQTIDERASVDDHERLYDAMTRDMMGRFDALAITRLHEYFSAYLN